MKVHELIELLEGFDEEAEVMLVTQQNWPFENDLLGAVERSTYDDGEDLDDGARMNDVLLVEGYQLRYGSKEPWEYV